MVFFIVLYTVVLTAVESVKRKSYNVIIQINITEEELSFDTVIMLYKVVPTIKSVIFLDKKSISGQKKYLKTGAPAEDEKN